MKVVIATGGTGGHLFPALDVAFELKGQGHDVLFMGSFRRSFEEIDRSGFRYIDFDVRGVSMRDPFSFIRMVHAVYKAIKHLKTTAPDAVAGFGGYGSFPAVCGAVLLRIPTIIHEQNVVPGKANKLLAPFTTRVALSFEQSAVHFKKGKTILTGCPTKAKKRGLTKVKARKELGLDTELWTLLVFGGSQGSQRINDIFLQTIREISKKKECQVIHLCGKNDYEPLKKTYNHIDVPHVLRASFADMALAYHAADIAICRAGAVTVTELALFKVPAVLVPYPHAQGHQKENADVLRRSGLAVIIEENQLTQERLAKAVEHVALLARESAPIKTFVVPDAGKRVADHITALVS